MTKPRTTEPMRTQGVIRFEMPDDELAHDHRERVLWLATGKLDLSAFLAGGRRSVHGSAALTADAADAVDLRDLARRRQRECHRTLAS